MTTPSWPTPQPTWKAWACPACHRRYDDPTPGPGCDRCNPTPPEQRTAPTERAA